MKNSLKEEKKAKKSYDATLIFFHTAKTSEAKIDANLYGRYIMVDNFLHE